MENKKGYTLIELVIAIGIVLILGTSIVSAYINLNRSRVSIYEIQDVSNKLQNAMENAIVSIKNSNSNVEYEDVNVELEKVSDDLFEVRVSFGEKYELKKVGQKRVYSD